MTARPLDRRLGLDFGVDFNSPALRLPFVGRIGMNDTSRDGGD